MLELISANWLVFLIALIIGVATAYWVWGRVNLSAGYDSDAALDAPDTRIDSGKLDIAPVEMAPVAAVPVGLAASEAYAAPVIAPDAPRPAIAAAVGEPDDLEQIKGVGPKLNELLNSMGVTRFDQIAAWSASDVAEVDQYLGAFQGRIERDGWIDQAGYLARGDVAGFEEKYGKI